MNKVFEINLIVGKEFIGFYRSSLVPVVGDNIVLAEDKIFEVERRILPSEENGKIVLYGRFL